MDKSSIFGWVLVYYSWVGRGNPLFWHTGEMSHFLGLWKICFGVFYQNLFGFFRKASVFNWVKGFKKDKVWIHNQLKRHLKDYFLLRPVDEQPNPFLFIPVCKCGPFQKAFFILQGEALQVATPQLLKSSLYWRRWCITTTGMPNCWCKYFRNPEKSEDKYNRWQRVAGL